MLKLSLVPSDRWVSALPANGWIFSDVFCRFCKGTLYVAKLFEADFTVEIDKPNESSSSLLSLLGPRGSIRDRVLIELTRAAFPTVRSAQVSFL